MLVLVQVKCVIASWRECLAAHVLGTQNSIPPEVSGETVESPALQAALGIAEAFCAIQLPYACVGLTLQPESSGSLALLLIELKMSLASCVRLQTEVEEVVSRSPSFGSDEALLPVAQMQLQLSAMVAQYGAVVQAALAICTARPIARDLSEQFTAAYTLILKALKESSSVPKKRIDTSTLSKGRAVQYIQDKLAKNQIHQVQDLDGHHLSVL
jgi:hypothetical protein